MYTIFVTRVFSWFSVSRKKRFLKAVCNSKVSSVQGPTSVGLCCFYTVIMKKIISTLALFLCLTYSFSQNVYEQLNNSVVRSEGGAGAVVEYHVYLSPTTEKVFRASEWESGKVVGELTDPQYFELTRKVMDEEESLVINLETLAYLELEIKTVKGKKHFEYHFYY